MPDDDGPTGQANADVQPVTKMKEVVWVGSSQRDLLDIPVPVRRELGQTLMAIPYGETPNNTWPFEGATGQNIMKIKENFDTDTYRLVYAAKFEKSVYVLHVFKKKSASGKSTPKTEIDLVHQRYREAQEHYKRTHGGK